MEQLSALDHAYALADQWAGELLGAERVPELCRYVARLPSDLDERHVHEAVDYFADLNFVDWLPQATLRDVTRKVRAGAAMKAVARDTPIREAPILDTAEPAGDHRVSIMFTPEHLPQHADQTERALILPPGHRLHILEDGKPPRLVAVPDHLERVFAHGNAYAVVRSAKPVTVSDMRTRDDAGATIVHLADRESMRQRLMGSCKFFKAPKGSGSVWSPDMACDLIVNNLLARRGGIAPPLTGLLTAPTIGADGRLIEIPGYDDASGLFCAFRAGDFPKIKSYQALRTETGKADLDAARLDIDEAEYKRARRDAAAAYSFLVNEVFGEFVFASPEDEAAAVAALLTVLVRRTCGITPGFLASAALQGCGKTTLLSVIGCIAEGAMPAIAPWPEGDDELRKQLTALCMAGRSAVIFDNIRNGAVVDSPSLARFLTSETWQDRILGRTESVALPTSVLIGLTGNNPVLSGDMASRVLEIRLDAEDDRPDRRTFKRNLFEWAQANRPEIVERALTILKAWADVGEPQATATRFPLWDRMVRQAILFAGGPDIAAKFDRAHQEDPVIGQLQELVRLWRPALGDEPVTAGDILTKLDRGAPFSEPRDSFLRALTDLVADGRGVKLNPRTVGLRLKKFADRPIGGQRVVSTYDNHSKNHFWSIVETGERR